MFASVSADAAAVARAEVSVVAAGALVPEGMQVPAGMLAMGSPAKVRREVSPEEEERFRKNCDNYVEITAIYKEEQS